jgi:S-adenosylmethionine:tRNA ribosyltransferase-isomerase
LKTTDFDYDLPPEYIAQQPLKFRDASRLLILNRESGKVRHGVFKELGHYLKPGDLLILNETRVIPARLYGRKIPTGGRVEVLLLRRMGVQTWEVWVGGKKIKVGLRLAIEDGPQAEVLEMLAGPRRLIKFSKPIEPYLDRAGHMPLPPYIHTKLEDPERYQTVLARKEGSAAAPTAGLHFTRSLLDELQKYGVGIETLTLHVGLDTFAPVEEDDPREHKIHTEWCQLTSDVATMINQTHRQGGRIIAVGTTSVRTLESAARYAAVGELVGAFEGSTDLFILPGYEFKVVQAMITNFHLPRSTLIMLVSAFVGRRRLLEAYQMAIKEGYRFYSFGDAMLII